MAGWLGGYVMYNYIVCDWVVKGSSPTQCNILYGIFGPSLVPPSTIRDYSGLLWLAPSPSRSAWEQMAAPGGADVLLVLSALLELPDLWRHWEHKGFFLMLQSEAVRE